jgi:hypothetical protein
MCVRLARDRAVECLAGEIAGALERCGGPRRRRKDVLRSVGWLDVDTSDCPCTRRPGARRVGGRSRIRLLRPRAQRDRAGSGSARRVDPRSSDRSGGARRHHRSGGPGRYRRCRAAPTRSWARDRQRCRRSRTSTPCSPRPIPGHDQKRVLGRYQVHRDCGRLLGRPRRPKGPPSVGGRTPARSGGLRLSALLTDEPLLRGLHTLRREGRWDTPEDLAAFSVEDWRERRADRRAGAGARRAGRTERRTTGGGARMDRDRAGRL